ncbi:MAG: DNA-3-methyladenine glycosylase II [uncultured Truepera sp.]|uniref:Putative 3-methyladenine DNA glycosylase n=1 Tax=uncultured Truepera sp. TaxID=543023 RepID=A0A6J4VMZ3_9DEIN|nr:MAG: DNA-3-methyladenine glycosylase II [uncultured Truepera sp.]
MTALPHAFYAQDAETVAKALLGATLVFETKRVRIVETEAYVGTHDLAAHSSKGRTARTDVMFGPPGRAYLYLIYGMYELFNVVTGDEGDAQAVLIRAAEPLENVTGKTDGPGKLTRALGLDRAYNRHDLTAPPLTLTTGTPPSEVVTTTRVGVDYAGAWKDAPLRFYDASSRWVSRR